MYQALSVDHIWSTGGGGDVGHCNCAGHCYCYYFTTIMSLIDFVITHAQYMKDLSPT